VNDISRQQIHSTSGVLVSVCDEPGKCPVCNGPWHIQKTILHHGKTIAHGQFEIRETIHKCASGCKYDTGVLVTRRALSLCKHIIPGRVVGYDVMTFIGLQRFFHHRQREEVRTELLREHGILLSSGEISNLAKLFLAYLKQLHNKHMGQLQNILEQDGGWPLHVDATGEDGRGTLFVAYAGWRKWVLGAWKIPTERTAAILPCLHEVVQQFGTPCAIMRDLGRAITLAVNSLLIELGVKIPILACHLHFLSDIGSDLLKSVHGELRELFRRKKIRPKLRSLVRELGRKLGDEIKEAREEVKIWQEQPGTDFNIPQGRAGLATIRALIQWILDYDADSTGQDFPFDRPYLYFYDRCLFVHKAIKMFLLRHQEDHKNLKILNRLQRILQPVSSEVPFRQIVKRLQARAKLFDELRNTIRLTPDATSIHNKSKASYTSNELAKELQDIRNELDLFEASLKDRRPERGPATDMRNAIDLILCHINKHGEYLWGHAIPLSPEAGGAMRLVERTNNILESFFGNMKHKERRRSGRKILTQDFECLPPEAALVYNLEHDDYVSVVCGSLDHLHEAFAKLDLEKDDSLNGIDKGIDALLGIPQAETASLPTADRRLIRRDEMQRRIAAAAKSRVTRSQKNSLG